MIDRADRFDEIDDFIDDIDLPPGKKIKRPVKKRPPPTQTPPPVTKTPEPAEPTPAQPEATPAQPAPAVEPEPVVETPTKIVGDDVLRNLIRDIPIANPGSLITDEYHNSLRDAVRALGYRIGLSINQRSESDILSFAPNFLPVKPLSPNVPNLNWNVTLESASIPAVSVPDPDNPEGPPKPVAGGFVVQLPDFGDIHEMIVWGKRDKDAAKPQEFTVTLNRKKLGSNELPQTLISIDLKDVNEGAFDKSVELSEREIPLLDEDEGETGKTTVSKRRVINNEKWVYFVSAVFIAGGNTAAEKYEINSIQIYCIV